jgi:hypothetical protein
LEERIEGTQQVKGYFTSVSPTVSKFRRENREGFKPKEVVREMREQWYRIMFRKNVPKIFWDSGMRWVCEITSRTHTRSHRIDGGIPLQKNTGDTVDISNYIDSGFYDCRIS